jgi:hypothetical protein
MQGSVSGVVLLCPAVNLIPAAVNLMQGIAAPSRRRELVTLDLHMVQLKPPVLDLKPDFLNSTNGARVLVLLLLLLALLPILPVLVLLLPLLGNVMIATGKV